MWTHGKIGPGNPANPVNWVHVKRPFIFFKFISIDREQYEIFPFLIESMPCNTESGHKN